MRCELWADVRSPEGKDGRKALLLDALESGISNFAARREDSDFTGLAEMKLLFFDSEDVTEIDITDPDDMGRAMALAGRPVTVVVRASDWKVIPLENMVAAFEGTPTRILVRVASVEDASMCMNVLEKGVHGILVEDSFVEYSKLISSERPVALSAAEVVSVADAGVGDRVCVDTVSLMSPGEGMLVGSQSSCMFLVQSESESSGYVESRPFRVNAGAVHTYAMCPEGRTKYLSELRSGDFVLLVDRSGAVRTSAVGRCKVERRPFLMVTARCGPETYTAMLQNAETVRLVTPGGSKAVTSLEPGDEVLVRTGDGGRHFGMSVDETVRELR